LRTICEYILIPIDSFVSKVDDLDEAVEIAKEWPLSRDAGKGLGAWLLSQRDTSTQPVGFNLVLTPRGPTVTQRVALKGREIERK